MVEKVKVSDLLNSEMFDRHKEELVNYFAGGGTWHSLLGYDENILNAYYEKAYNFYSHAQYADAAAAFSYLTVLNPYEYRYWIGFAMAKQSDRLFEEALVGYTTASAIEPENPLPLLHLAQCYHALRLDEQAIEELNGAIKLAKEDVQYRDVSQKAQTILNHLRKR